MKFSIATKNFYFQYLIVIMLCFLGHITSAFAISEKNFWNVYNSRVVTFFKERVEKGSFLGVNDVHINYIKIKNPKERAVIVLLPGRTEALFKYDEVIYDLYNQGYSFYGIDHRGQGGSGRVLQNKQKGHVVDFDYYVKDFEKFVFEIIPKEDRADMVALAHSMGGGILATFSLRNPGAFKKKVFVSPLFGINTGMIPDRMAYWVLKGADFLGFGESYLPGDGDWEWSPKEPSRVSNSAVRVEKAAGQFKNRPDKVVGGPTVNWVLEALNAARDIQEKAHKLDGEILLLQGDEDSIISLSAHDEVCAKAKRCKKIVFKDALHEILHEKDAIRDKAIQDIVHFFDN